jgi:hypothetical protein
MSENYDEFMLLVYLTDDLTPGRTLYFPTVHSARAAYTSTVGIMSPPKLDPAAQPLIVHAACEGLKAGSDVYRHPGKIPALQVTFSSEALAPLAQRSRPGRARDQAHRRRL